MKRAATVSKKANKPSASTAGQEPPATPLKVVFGGEPVLMKLLHQAGLTTVEAVQSASDEELLAIEGILTTRLRKIRALAGGNIL